MNGVTGNPARERAMSAIVCASSAGQSHPAYSELCELVERAYGEIDYVLSDTSIQLPGADLTLIFDDAFLLAQTLRSDPARRVVYIPCLFEDIRQDLHHWRMLGQPDNLTFLSFSSFQHGELLRAGMRSLRFQYFQRASISEERNSESLDAFDWILTGKAARVPNTPPYSEYVMHGVHGYIADTSLKSEGEDARKIELRARRAAEYRTRIWEEDKALRLTKLFKPNCDQFLTVPAEHSWAHWGRGDSAKPRSVTQSGVDFPQVTVAIVALNEESTIERTLRSSVLQDYPNMEIIFVDGGSTDGTHSIANKYADDLDKFIIEKDDGPYSAMNRAAEAAKSDYIIFMNSGDHFLRKDTLSEVMSLTAEAHLDARDFDGWPDIVFGNHVYQFVSGETALHVAQCFDQTWRHLREGEIDVAWLSGIPCHQATMTKTNLLQQSLYDLSYKITADHAFLFEQRRRGASFFHCGLAISFYYGGGMSWTEGQRCAHESWKIASSHTKSLAPVWDFYHSLHGPKVFVENMFAVEAECAALRQSGQFWEDWYRMENMAGRPAAEDPIEHFVLSGKAAGFELSGNCPFEVNSIQPEQIKVYTGEN